MLPNSGSGKRSIFLSPTSVSGSVGGGGTQGAANALSFVQGCKSITTASIAGDQVGEFAFPGYPLHLAYSSYNHNAPPNSYPCLDPSEQSWLVLGPLSAAPPTSNHPGGVNVGFCDGSVHFIKDTVALQAWWALGSRALGETVSSDQY